jgi:outer membrane receptor protein involved in Fe transport
MRTNATRIAAILLAVAFAATAQEFRGSISGLISDPSGAPVAGARVTLTSVERNISQNTVTTDAGVYSLQYLLPGQYTIAVEREGFKKTVREGIRVSSSDHIGLDLRLDLGALAETVTVTAEAPLLQTESASRAALIEKQYLDNIPTSGRNLYQLQYVQPGVLKNSNYWGDFELYATGNMNGVMINGGRAGQNETLLDGLPNTRPDSGVTSGVALNAVEEVTVLSNAYDAQYGRFGGGITSITIRSGTNSLHGQLFEFLENEKLYATPWTSNALGIGKTPFKQSVFGFTVDGPVYIPKVIDGRNKLFFMLSLEGLRERNPGLQEATLPTAEQLQGDFSKLTDNQGRPITIYDPTTTTLRPDGTYSRTPFPGNRIPANRINPVAAKIASFYPSPNRQPLGADGRSNYVRVTPAKNSYDSWLGKMDWRVTEKNQISWRYGQTPWSNFAQVLWGTNAAEPSGEAPSTRVSRTWGADWTRTLSPAMIFNLRGGLARYEGFSGNIYAGGFDPRELGFPQSLVGQFTAVQFPRFNLGTYAPLGATRVVNYETHDTWSVQPNLSWTTGRHTMKYGVEFRLYNQNRLQPGAAAGNYTFDKRWTQADPLRGDALSGNEFASFLLGHPSSGFVDRNIDPAYQNTYYVAYVQDDWKIAPNITLNLGLRWDYESPRKERYNRMIRGFEFDQQSPLASQVQGLDLRGGLAFAGSSGDARLAYVPDRNNFQPRIGIAWQLSPKWVIRAGYGLTYLPNASNGPDTGFSQPTSLVATTDNVTPAVSLSDPFSSTLFPSGLLKPIGSSNGLATNLGQNVAAQYLDFRTALSHQYSLGVQRELPWSMLLDVSYVGNITRNLPVNLPLNSIPGATLNSLPVDQRPAFFNAQVTNPMRGLLPGTAFNGNTIPRSQTLVAYPHFNQVTIQNVPIGSQRYDSMQLKLQRRFQGGLAMQVAYTLSKTLEQASVLNNQDVTLDNLLNTGLERRLVEFDSPHTLAALVSYELPWGRGRRFGSSMNRWLDAFAGGWNLNVQHVVRSGSPVPFPNAAPLEARSAKFTHSERDELARTKGRDQFDPVFDVFFDTSLFPRRARPAFTLQDYPTRFPDVRFKALNAGEVSISKNFRIKERVTFQLRADAQNAYNYPWFSRIQSADVTNSQFGVLNPSPRTEAREIILVGKIIF